MVSLTDWLFPSEQKSDIEVRCGNTVSPSFVHQVSCILSQTVQLVEKLTSIKFILKSSTSLRQLLANEIIQ